MKKHIYGKYLKRLEDIDNIIKLIDNLAIQDKIEFLEELIKVCEFTIKEFYSNKENKENKRIKLLYHLSEVRKIEVNNTGKLAYILDDIRRDLEESVITKKILEKFLNLKKKEIKDETKKGEEKKHNNFNNEEKHKLFHNNNNNENINSKNYHKKNNSDSIFRNKGIIYSSSYN
jgi:hypothetical protein